MGPIHPKALVRLRPKPPSPFFLSDLCLRGSISSRSKAGGRERGGWMGRRCPLWPGQGEWLPHRKWRPGQPREWETLEAIVPLGLPCLRGRRCRCLLARSPAPPYRKVAVATQPAAPRAKSEELKGLQGLAAEQYFDSSGDGSETRSPCAPAP